MGRFRHESPCRGCYLLRWVREVFQADKDGNAQTGKNVDQGSYSIIGQYWNGPIGFKLGYAANLESETNGKTDKNSDSNTISGQLMAVHNGFVPYLRVAGRTVGDADTDIVTRIGLEYGF